jgi:hypothetical protein
MSNTIAPTVFYRTLKRIWVGNVRFPRSIGVTSPLNSKPSMSANAVIDSHAQESGPNASNATRIATMLRALKFGRLLVINVVVAIIGPAILETAIGRVFPAHSLVTVLWKEWILSITCAASIGFWMWHMWRSDAVFAEHSRCNARQFPPHRPISERLAVLGRTYPSRCVGWPLSTLTRHNYDMTPTVECNATWSVRLLSESTNPRIP